MKFVVSGQEYEHCIELMKQRQRSKRAAVKSRKIDDSRSDLEIEVGGYIAEKVVREYLSGIDANQDLKPSQGDAGYDVVVGDRRVEVKWFHHRNSPKYCLQHFSNTPNFDYVVQVKTIEEGPSHQIVEIMGWLDKAAFEKEKTYLHWLKRPTFGVLVSKFKPIEELKALLHE